MSVSERTGCEAPPCSHTEGLWRGRRRGTVPSVDVAHFVLDFVKAIAWPSVTIVGLLLFRKEIRSAVARIRRAEALGVAVGLGEVKDVVETVVDQLENLDQPEPLLGLWLATAEDQGVQPGFADDAHLLVARGGVHTVYPPLVVIQKADRRAVELEDVEDVAGDKPRLVVDDQRADLAGLGVDEGARRLAWQRTRIRASGGLVGWARCPMART